MKKLVLGPVGLRELAPEEVPLGPWVFTEQRDVAGWLDTNFVADPLGDPPTCARAVRACETYLDEHAEELTSWLNAESGLGHSWKFWRVYAGPWVLALLQVLWERQHRIEAFIRRHAGSPFQVELPPAQVEWGFIDSKDMVVRGLRGPAFNEWLCGCLLRQLAPRDWMLTESAGRTPSQPATPVKKNPRWKIWIARKLTLCLRGWGAYGVSPLRSVGLTLVLELAHLLPRRKKSNRSPAIFSEKLEPASKEKPGSWVLPPLTLIKACLPATIMHPPWRGWLTVYRPGAIRLVGNALGSEDDLARIVAAQAVEWGERLVVCQHGGNYGTAAVNANGSGLEYRQWRFMSWGWSEHLGYRENIIPLPSPLLSRLRWQGQTGSEIVMVNGWAVPYFFIQYGEPQPVQALNYFRDGRAFCREINLTIRNALRYRGYANAGPRYAGFDEYTGFTAFPRIEAGLQHRLAGARVVVVNHPVTTFLISLAAGIPTVGFWRAGDWALCPAAERAFEELRAAGIVHTTGLAAARHLNQVYPDVLSWWEDATVRAARQKFCTVYARADPDWYGLWLRKLWELGRQE